MKVKRPVYILVSILLLGLLTAFQLTVEEQAELANDPQVLEALAKKIDQYTQIRARICREEVIEKANAIVDSMLLEISRRAKQEDTLTRPPRPVKPPRPPIVLPKDSTPLAPFFRRDSLRRDSLKAKGN